MFWAGQGGGDDCSCEAMSEGSGKHRSLVAVMGPGWARGLQGVAAALRQLGLEVSAGIALPRGFHSGWGIKGWAVLYVESATAWQQDQRVPAERVISNGTRLPAEPVI
jgi:hypothetical protein